MKNRVRITVLAEILAVAVAAGAAMFTLGGDSNYGHVTSIEQTNTFRDPALLAEAERLPVARAYLFHAFEYQHNGSVCGPTSAADLLHSIGRGESQEQVMTSAGVRSILGYVIPGLTLDQEASLLGKETGEPVTLLRDIDLKAFRALLTRTNDPALRFIANFHRGPMFGRGGGHLSPILGYLQNRDLALVGDVNRSYGIYLVSSRRLFDAMNTIDSITGKKRGLLMMAVKSSRASSGQK